MSNFINNPVDNEEKAVLIIAENNSRDYAQKYLSNE